MDEPERDRRIAEAAAVVADLVATTRRERDQRRAAGEDIAWLEQVLVQLQPLAEQLHDLQLVHATRRVVERHGPGPYPLEDLAAIAGVDDVDAFRRVVDQMVTDGLATPPGDPPGSPGA